MESFGTLVRRKRKARELLLREVAAKLEIDPSLLSRIEGGTKQATRQHAIKLAAILQGDENEFLIAYLSDKITYELQGEKLALKAISLAEEKIKYVTSGSGPKNPLKKNEAQ